MQTLDLSAIDIASFVTKFCALNNYFINITKLQKLVYCCYGVVLAAQDTRLCKEHPKTWAHGPWKSDVAANGYFRKMDDMKIKNYFEKTLLKQLNAI